MSHKLLFAALALVASAFIYYAWLPESGSPMEGSGVVAVGKASTKPSLPTPGKSKSSELAQFDDLSDEAKIQFLDEQKAKAAPKVLADLAMRAMESQNLEVRTAAIASINQLQSSELLPVVRRALSDPSEELRLRALHEARQKAPVLRLNLLESALSSEFVDTRDGALIELTRENPKAAVPIMMGGLNSSDPDFRQRVWQEILPNIQALRKESFPNATEALNWWNQVRDKFDQGMILLDPPVAPSEN
jgi:hypothetical protein